MHEIRYEVADGVATLTIDRPDKRGAMTYAMLDEFTDRVGQAGADDAVRVLLVTGTPGSFCAGIGPALRLLYTGEDLDADRALALGFATEVVAPDELPAAADRLARTIAAASPFALVRTKKLVQDGAGADLPAHAGATRIALAECFASADHKEGVAAFLEKRPARFTGR